MVGFFPAAASITKRHEQLLPRCGACGLYKTCNTPKMPVSGLGKMGILLIGEAPSQDEDRFGSHLEGPASSVLLEELSDLGVDPAQDCWVTNSLICRPEDGAGPTPKQVDQCRPNLNQTIKELNPRIIIPMGPSAVRSLLGPLWKDSVGPIEDWVGWKIPLQRHNAWTVPTWDPSAVREQLDSPAGSVMRLWFKRHLASAVNAEARPWTELPDYASQVRIVLDPRQVVEFVKRILKNGGSVAFDYETNMLKPDAEDAEIVCCSLCWNGKETISYPWVGAAIEATRRLLVSGIPMLGANNKFEGRWGRKHLGVRVKRWSWDAMLSAHHLDNRSGITSVKFQAFVRLGFEPWGKNIKPFLIGATSNSKNRIRELDLNDLLLYCGIDSLVEFLIAQIQKKEMMADADVQ